MKPIDKIAMIIAATTSIILLLITVSPLVTGRPLSEAKAQIVGNLISSFIAILSMYVGARLKHDSRLREVPNPETKTPHENT